MTVLSSITSPIHVTRCTCTHVVTATMHSDTAECEELRNCSHFALAVAVVAVRRRRRNGSRVSPDGTLLPVQEQLAVDANEPVAVSLCEVPAASVHGSCMQSDRNTTKFDTCHPRRAAAPQHE